MRAVVVAGPGEMALERVPDPAPGDRQVVVQVAACGICGTDVHVVAGDYPIARYPVIPGHEFGGEIVAVGRAVSHLRPGQVVAVDPTIACGHCRSCRDGWPNQCEHGGGLGTTAPGAFAELVAVDAARCVVLPDAMPEAWAVVAEPLACVLHAIDRIGPVLGARALVIGGGPSGLLMCAALSRAGARVDLVERSPERLAYAERFGAGGQALSLDELQRPDGWDLVVDVTGSAAAMEAGLARVRRFGRFHVFGVAGPDARVALSPYQAFSRELTLTGSTSPRHSFGRAVELLSEGVVPADLLVCDRTPLAAAADAIARARDGIGLKSQLAPAADALLGVPAPAGSAAR